MNRRGFLAGVAALPGAVVLPEALAQTGQQITHVDTKTDGAMLKSSVVKAASLQAEGAAPGAKAFVSFNGPTKQLAALASGLVTLEPGGYHVMLFDINRPLKAGEHVGVTLVIEQGGRRVEQQVQALVRSVLEEEDPHAEPKQ